MLTLSLLLFFWLGLAIVVGVIANGRGRDGFGWFLLALVISPLLAAIFLAAAGSKAGPAMPRRACPSCAEPILYQAKLCPHCHSEVPVMAAPAPTPAGPLVAGVCVGTLAVLYLIGGDKMPNLRSSSPTLATTGSIARQSDNIEDRTGCSATQFTVEKFASAVFDDCRATPCPALKLTGKLRNNCAMAFGAQIKITAEDGKGNVIDTVEGWPASTRNIAAGESYSFDFGPLMAYRPRIKRFSVQVIEVKDWKR